MFGRKKKGGGELRPDVAAAVQAGGVTGFPVVLRGIGAQLHEGETVSLLAESTTGMQLAILTNERFAVVTKGSGMKHAPVTKVSAAQWTGTELTVSAPDFDVSVPLAAAQGQPMADAINALK